MKKKIKLETLRPFFMDKINCHKATEPLRGDSFHLLPLSPQEFLVFIYRLWEDEPATPGLGIQRPNHQAIAI